MGYYLLYDHFDHLLDELEFAQHAYRSVYAYVKLLEQRSEQAGHVTITTAIAVTWMRPVDAYDPCGPPAGGHDLHLPR